MTTGPDRNRRSPSTPRLLQVAALGSLLSPDVRDGLRDSLIGTAYAGAGDISCDLSQSLDSAYGINLTTGVDSEDVWYAAGDINQGLIFRGMDTDGDGDSDDLQMTNDYGATWTSIQSDIEAADSSIGTKLYPTGYLADSDTLLIKDGNNSTACEVTGLGNTGNITNLNCGTANCNTIPNYAPDGNIYCSVWGSGDFSGHRYDGSSTTEVFNDSSYSEVAFTVLNTDEGTAIFNDGSGGDYYLHAVSDYSGSPSIVQITDGSGGAVRAEPMNVQSADHSGSGHDEFWIQDFDDGYEFKLCTDPTTSAAVDNDGDGYDTDSDCDDSNASVYPGATEYCDGIDNNCDGDIDEDSATDAVTWSFDFDNDGYGDASDQEIACDAPSGYVTDATDCDDNDNSTHPGADEYCTGTDNDCDGEIDEGALDASTWYSDIDGDGNGNPDEAVEACDAPDGYVGNSDDTCPEDAENSCGEAPQSGQIEAGESIDTEYGSITVGAGTVNYEQIDGQGISLTFERGPNGELQVNLHDFTGQMSDSSSNTSGGFNGARADVMAGILDGAAPPNNTEICENGEQVEPSDAGDDTNTVGLTIDFQSGTSANYAGGIDLPETSMSVGDMVTIADIAACPDEEPEDTPDDEDPENPDDDQNSTNTETPVSGSETSETGNTGTGCAHVSFSATHSAGILAGMALLGFRRRRE